VEFSRELRNDVLAGDITLSVRLWKRPRVKQGGRYRVGPGEIEVDAIELVPFAAITRADVRRSGEADRETLRQRAAHAGPVDAQRSICVVNDRRAWIAIDRANSPARSIRSTAAASSRRPAHTDQLSSMTGRPRIAPSSRSRNLVPKAIEQPQLADSDSGQVVLQ